MTGERTTDVVEVAALDELLGNVTVEGELRTGRMKTDDLSAQLAGDGPLAAALSSERGQRIAGDQALDAARIAGDQAVDAARIAGDLNVMTTLGAQIAAIESTTREGVVVFATKAAMEGDLDYEENTKARVYTDPLPVNNGIYRKDGAAESGFWVFIRAIDDYNFSVTIELLQSATVIAGTDTGRKRLAVTNKSAAATVALDVTGGTPALGDSTSILLPPGTGIYMDGSDCPVASISAVADQDGVEIDVFIASMSAADPTVDIFVANFATPPTSPRKAAIAALRGGLISSGLLAKLEGLWVFAAADADAASVNWVDGSKTLTTAGSPTFTADRGYTGDGTDAVLHTGMNLPTGKFGQDHASMACWVRDTGTGLSEFTLGYGAGAIVANRSLTTIGVRANTTGTQTITKPSGAGGFFGWSRLDATEYKVYWGADFTYTDPVASGSLL